MKNLKLAAIATSLCLAFSAAAVGAPLSKAQYQAGKDEASNKYKSDKAACRSMSGNAQDICIEEAKGRESIAKAELEAKYEPSAKHSYEVRLATAEAAYAVAKEKCDALAGDAKASCISAAKTRYGQ